MTNRSVPLTTGLVLVVQEFGARLGCGVGLGVGEGEGEGEDNPDGDADAGGDVDGDGLLGVTPLTAEAEPPLPLQPAVAQAATNSTNAHERA